MKTDPRRISLLIASLKLAGLLAVGVSLSACASVRRDGPDRDVEEYSCAVDGQAAADAGRFVRFTIEPAASRASGDELEFREHAGLAARVLEKRGFFRVVDPSRAEIVIRLSHGETEVHGERTRTIGLEAALAPSLAAGRGRAILWRTTIVASNWSDDIRAVVASMLVAAEPYLAMETDGGVRTSVRSDNPAFVALRAPARAMALLPGEARVSIVD